MTLPENLQRELVAAALEVRHQAYSPYSNYAVGAALLCGSGKIVRGVNVENAAYPLTICAERAAVFAAIAQGERQFQAIAVATDNGGAPCGSCRQVLAEFGLQTQVLLVNRQAEVVQKVTVGDLLPIPFLPSDLSAS